jgi:transposase
MRMAGSETKPRAARRQKTRPLALRRRRAANLLHGVRHDSRLRVKAMARGMGRRAIRRGVADAALGELRRQITYKGAWAAREVVPIDTFYPGSGSCSGCGAVNAALKLQKHWQCLA